MSPIFTRSVSLIACGLIGLLFSSFDGEAANRKKNELRLKGVGFDDKGLYPKEYTCDSTGISPAIQWEGLPNGTTGYVLTMHHLDPTGNKHIYWVVYNIPKSVQFLSAGVTNIGSFGVNNINRTNAYAPPCSKGPGPKQYVITLYAISKLIDPPQATRDITMDVVMSEIEQSKLDSSVISVIYSRSPKTPFQRS